MVAAEHHDVVGTVAMSSMRDVRASDVKITLVVNGGQTIATRVKPDGSFALLDVPPGSHLLDAFALGYTFPPLRVTVQTDGVIRAEYAEDATEWFEAPLKLRPVSRAEYFEPRQGLNLASMAKNPYYILIAVTALLTFYMPKLLENLDPEELAELQEKMGKMGDMTAPPDIGKAWKDAQDARAKQQSENNRRAQKRE